MLDFDKPMQVRGSGKKVTRYLGEIKRATSPSSLYNHAFVQENGNGTEDIIWRTAEGKHTESNPQYDVINSPSRREVHLNVSRQGVLRQHPTVTSVVAYARDEMYPHDDYDSLTLTYEGDKLVDVGFLMQG